MANDDMSSYNVFIFAYAFDNHYNWTMVALVYDSQAQSWTTVMLQGFLNIGESKGLLERLNMLSSI